jgi:NTE family protein
VTGHRTLSLLLALLLPVCISTGSAGAGLATPDSLVIRNLVFGGGGVRGVAYVGALEVLEGRGMLRSVGRVGGTSAGAITALLVALGYSSGEMRAILGQLDMQDFNDGRWFFAGGFHRLSRHYGWYRGDRFEKWLTTLIARKTGQPDLTFAQLHRLVPGTCKDLYVTGTDLTAQQSVVFSWQHTPDMPLRTAVRISMSIPLYFGAVFTDDHYREVRRPRRGQSYHILVDGGLTANYPLSLFDSAGRANPETLGLKLERPEQVSHTDTVTRLASYRIDGISSYLSAVYTYTMGQLNPQPTSADDFSRTIRISWEDIGPRVRRMRPAETQRLCDSGRQAALRFRP